MNKAALHRRLPILSEKKLLLKLGQKKYRLRLADNETQRRTLELCCETKRDGLRPVATVGADTTSALLSAGVLKLTGNFAHVTRAGRSTIKRTLALHDGFLKQHRKDTPRLMTVNGDKQTVTVNSKESPLVWLATRKDRSGTPMILSHQLAAGERLRSDFERAQCLKGDMGGWDRLKFGTQHKNRHPSARMMITDAMIDAKKRLLAAVETVGPELSAVLFDVCCYQLGLADTEKKNNLPKRSGKVVLRMGLNQLARHYGLLWDDEIKRRSVQRISYWGVEDFRPTVSDDNDLN